MPESRLLYAGDSTLVLEFDAMIDPGLNARVIAIADALESSSHAGVRDVVPTYRSVAVSFDPLRVDLDGLVRDLTRLADTVRAAPESRPVIEVPVCYGGEFGPDLEDVAAFAGCSPEEAIARHAAPAYRVYMLGFVPGFAYMGSVDPTLQLGRHATPRLKVPVGAVAIAGFQTGVYAMETPGGWRVIGRTPLKPFDPRRRNPFLFDAGDSVRFVPIDRDHFARLASI